jgi:ribosomal protein S27AE
MNIPDDMMFLAAVLAAEEKFEKDDKCPKCNKKLIKDHKVPSFRLICKSCGYKSIDPL